MSTSRWIFLLRHHLNALHVMAFLVRLGISRRQALVLAGRWERLSHRWLYPEDQ
jgi:glycosylphosphatidylinositol transamidase (GPIT) subunit GPI8